MWIDYIKLDIYVIKMRLASPISVYRLIIVCYNIFAKYNLKNKNKCIKQFQNEFT